MKKFLRLLLIVIFLSSYTSYSYAYWVWSPDLGKWVNPKKSAKDTPEAQFEWAMQFYEAKNLDRAIEEFEKIPAAFPSSRLAAEGVYYSAICWEAKNDLAKSADNYQKLIDKYPYSDRIKDAIKHEFEIANKFAQGEKVKVVGVALLPGQEKALELYQHVVKNAPFGSYGDEAQFQIGEVYKSIGDYQEAQKAYQMVVDEYPNSALVAKARYQIAYVAMMASKKSQYSDEYAQRAIDEFQGFKEAYPSNAQAVEADESIKILRAKKAQTNYEVAAFYDKQKKYDSAKVYYQGVVTDYPETPAAATAKKRLDQLTESQTQPKGSGGFKFKLW